MLYKGRAPSPLPRDQMSFRLRGTHFLITWAQIDLEHHAVFDVLDSYSPIKGCVLARELHSDGQPHFHAFVEFDQRLDRNLTTQWDLGGRHPNVRVKRYRKDRRASAEYLRKGDNWIEFGSLSDGYEDDHEESLLDLVGACNDWGEVLNLCHAENIAFALAKAAWNYLGSTPPTTVSEGFHYGGEISSRDLLDLEYTSDEPPTSLFIGGRAGCGKSTWAFANAPRPALVVKHLEDLLFLRRDFHKALIFDDCSFAHLPRPTQIGIVDIEQTTTIHLRHIVTRIPAGLPRIFCYNLGFEPVNIHDEAIARRINILTV